MQPGIRGLFCNKYTFNAFITLKYINVVKNVNKAYNFRFT